MALSSDDFKDWENKHSPHPSGASHDHPLLDSVDTTGMPTFARLRLQDHVRNGRAPFTSNLSVGELLLARKLGYTPVAQVLGTSVYHIGGQFLNSSYFVTAGELGVLTQARNEAWHNALLRLEQQAHTAGTHIVVGVEVTTGGAPDKLHQSEAEMAASDVLEVSLMGTAARYKGVINPDKPLLSTLSAEDFIKLYAAGFFPVGIAYGCYVYYQPSQWSMLQGTGSIVSWGTQWQNQEIPEYSKGFMYARHQAIGRMNARAQALGGTQVVGIASHHHVTETEREIRQFENERKQVGVYITMEVYGTAVALTDPAARTQTNASVPLTD